MNSLIELIEDLTGRNDLNYVITMYKDNVMDIVLHDFKGVSFYNITVKEDEEQGFLLMDYRVLR